jgi:hypothetical protein
MRLIEADRAPTSAGVNVTDIVQLARAARLFPQVSISLKSVAFVPVTVMLVRLTVAVPGFETVSVWAALVVPGFWVPNETLVGLSETCGTPTPVPLRAAV